MQATNESKIEGGIPRERYAAYAELCQALINVEIRAEGHTDVKVKDPESIEVSGIKVHPAISVAFYMKIARSALMKLLVIECTPFMPRRHAVEAPAIGLDLHWLTVRTSVESARKILKHLVHEHSVASLDDLLGDIEKQFVSLSQSKAPRVNP